LSRQCTPHTPTYCHVQAQVQLKKLFGRKLQQRFVSHAVRTHITRTSNDASFRDTTRATITATERAGSSRCWGRARPSRRA
jgi:hypothetical protein